MASTPFLLDRKVVPLRRREIVRLYTTLGFAHILPRGLDHVLFVLGIFLKLHARRPLIVFCFGLLHGMGFAGVLSEIGLPRSEFVPALLSFNVGVELGQLTVILAAFITLGLPFRGKAWYRRRIVVPGSILIAAVGLYWFIQRAWASAFP